MIAARQELDPCPQLERLDRLIARSEGLDPGALSFAFRPLWQLDAPSQAALALQKAQATQIYAGLKLWPDAVTARLVEAQLVVDGTYPNAAAVFEESGAAEVGDAVTTDTVFAGAGAPYYLTEKKNRVGQWTEGNHDPDDSGQGEVPDNLLNLVSWRESNKNRLNANRRKRAKKLIKRIRGCTE